MPADALAIVSQPGAHDTNRRILAWAILMSARGQSVRQLTLRRLARAPHRLAACGHQFERAAQ